MKKVSNYPKVLLLMILLAPMHLFATHTVTGVEIPVHPMNEPTKLEIEVMITRLNEIKEMDKSNLTALEKKELRKEVRVMKKAVRSSSSGVYLSVGAVIIIVLLLILIL